MLVANFLLYSSILITIPGFPPEDKKIPKEMEGIWVPIKGEFAGQPAPPAFLKIELKIEGENYTVKAESVDKGVVKVGKEGALQTLDILGKDGPNKGKTILCIYEIKDGNLIVMYDLSGKNRPTKFQTEKGKPQMLLTYQKKKE